jgi:hypothetical protein
MAAMNAMTQERTVQHTTGTAASAPRPESARLYRRRMLQWKNPVEFVNNMYGCHPDGNGSEYFTEVFKR